MEHFQETIAYIKEQLPKELAEPSVAIVCGSGLGALASSLDQATPLPYASIPHFPQVTVSGHTGELVFGKVGDKTIVCMVGRFHFYEGHTLEKTIFPIRLMHLLGAKTLLVTNAAGSLNPAYQVGDLMLIHDHIALPSLVGQSPLRGKNDETLGPRFLPLSEAYSYDLRALALRASSSIPELNPTTPLDPQVIREGVYTYVGGPCYETPAEARALRSLGGDVVGMSTVPEVIAAAHCGMAVLGISLITNKVAMGTNPSATLGNPANHEEVLAASAARAIHLTQWVKQIVALL
ncbi:MAG: purine nucleoside phosphorylase-like protein [Piptocephalis tieghemiana]|nr:MAG: purine nucleoside phosphorylase-like protein [Piptocephalis tieghemiana]